MKAKFAGKCAATGRSYPAGAEIVKGASGWEIAAGPTSSSQSRPEPSWVRLASGQLTKIPLHLPSFCKHCVVAAGLNAADYSQSTDFAPLMPFAP